MTEPPVLETARLRLRPAVIKDADALFGVYSDEEASTWLPYPADRTIDETRARVARNMASETWRLWVITLTGDDHAIGTVGADQKRQGGVSEIGYLLVRRHWGKGLAGEAVSAVIDHLFAEGQRRIFADTDPENAASNRLLARLGFTLEGRLRAEWETHLGVRDSFIWGLLREEWRRP